MGNVSNYFNTRKNFKHQNRIESHPDKNLEILPFKKRKNKMK